MRIRQIFCQYGVVASLGLTLVAGSLLAPIQAFAQEGRSRSREGRGDSESRENGDSRGGFEGRGGEGRGGEGRGGFEGRGGEGRGGSSRWGDRPNPSDFLSRMDANGNGILEPDESSGRMRMFVERAARDAGMDPAQPLPVAKLQEAMNQSRERMQRGESGRSDSGRSAGRSESGRTDADGSSSVKPDEKNADGSVKKPAEKAVPLVPGFGEPIVLAMAPGFDVPLPTPIVVAQATPSGDSDRRRDRGSDRDRDRERERERDKDRQNENEKERSRSGGESSGSDDRTRRYAEAMLRQYDANKNGLLEKEEWSKMPGEPAKADKNGDGQVTQDELTQRLVERAKEGFGGSPGAGPGAAPGGGPSSGGGWGGRSSGSTSNGGWGGRGSSTSPRPTVNTATGRSIRFLTPQERLPEGLPSWFVQNDKDSDGQVSMAEYSSAWNDAKLVEYLKYDLNNDGWITPAECMAVEPAKK